MNPNPAQPHPDRRHVLRDKLVRAAEDRVRAHGVTGLRARDVTRDAGVALGGLYSAFESMDLLILTLNARTLARFAAAADAATARARGPEAQLRALALAYLDFARAETGVWGALFDYHRALSTPIPDELRQAIDGLIRRIAVPLHALRPDLDPAGLERRARTLFAAVHGVVQLALTRQFIAPDPAAIAGELDALVVAMARGLGEAGSPASGLG